MGEKELFNVIKKYIPLVERLPKKIKIDILPKKETVEKKIENEFKEKPEKNIETKIKDKKISLPNKKKDKKIASFWKAFYSTPKFSYGGAVNPYKQASISYSYTETDTSGVFVPQLQTFYVSDSSKLNEIDGIKLGSIVSVSVSDVYEVQRVGKMNQIHNNNYIDPEIMERYKLWSLFSFNFTKSVIMYDSIGS